MKAAILVKQKTPLVVDEVQMPDKLGYGQVLVKVIYSGVCGSQLNEIEGAKGHDKFLPHLLGHEGSGIVEKIGPGVTTVKVKDHVVLHWRKGYGIDSATPKYVWKNRPLNAGWVTTFNEYAIVSENRITSIPKDIDMNIASLYGCAMTTGYGVIHNDAKLKAGQSIVVFGSGGTGAAIIVNASLASANPIIAIDINGFKLKMAKTFGATGIINSKKENAKNKIFGFLNDGADVCVDTTGIKSIREMAYEVTGKEGVTVLVGVPNAGEKMCIDSFPLHFTKKITGSHGGSANPGYDIPRMIKLQKCGKFNLEKMITKTYPLDKINDGIAELKNGSIVRCSVKMH